MIMKKLLLIAIFLTQNIFGAVGCMSGFYSTSCGSCLGNNHYVECNCPCRFITERMGRCPRCGHVGDPNRGLINTLQDLDQVYW